MADNRKYGYLLVSGALVYDLDNKGKPVGPPDSFASDVAALYLRNHGKKPEWIAQPVRYDVIQCPSGLAEVKRVFERKAAISGYHLVWCGNQDPNFDNLSLQIALQLKRDLEAGKRPHVIRQPAELGLDRIVRRLRAGQVRSHEKAKSKR